MLSDCRSPSNTVLWQVVGLGEMVKSRLTERTPQRVSPERDTAVCRGHPTADVLARLHAGDIQTYWTNAGSGVAADSLWDKVGGDIPVEAMPGLGDDYKTAGTGFTDAYLNE